MNKLDPRFLKGNLYLIDSIFDGDNANVGNAASYEGYYFLLLDEQTTGQCAPAPANTIVYSDGERWVKFMPEDKSYILSYGEDLYQIFRGTLTELFSYGKKYPTVDKIVKEIKYSSTKPTKNGSNATYAVGDVIYLTNDAKFYTVTEVGNTGTLTWDTGTAIEGSYVALLEKISPNSVYIYNNDGNGNETFNSIWIGEEPIFYSKEDSKLYQVVCDRENSTYSFISVGGAQLRMDTHTLTAEEVTAKSFTLSSPAVSTSAICFVEGLAQAVNVAFAISGDTFSWDGKTLDGHLQAGDVIIVQYYA